jgi:lantibiotic modifying enzyme
LIPIFLHLHHTQGNPRLLALAIRAGERLLATAKPQPAGGVGWQSVSSQPLTGFSHGAAGIGWSLVCLWQVSQEERFKEYAQEAFAYERALFDSRRGFWPDLRDGSRPEGLAEGYEEMCAWCNGSVGIGLARLDVLRRCPEFDLEEEVSLALERALVAGFGTNHSLCHGDFGTLMFLKAASDAGAGAFPQAEGFQAYASGAIEAFQRGGFVSGVPTGVEVPGLLSGLAGVGLACLAIAGQGPRSAGLLLEPPDL